MMMLFSFDDPDMQGTSTNAKVTLRCGWLLVDDGIPFCGADDVSTLEKRARDAWISCDVHVDDEDLVRLRATFEKSSRFM